MNVGHENEIEYPVNSDDVEFRAIGRGMDMPVSELLPLETIPQRRLERRCLFRHGGLLLSLISPRSGRYLIPKHLRLSNAKRHTPSVTKPRVCR